ncbi:MAG TPA: EamA family transporter [Baekduia sp.]|nr:EamA family transporter [Baekduia sp.]
MPAARLHVLLASLCFGTTGTAQALGPDAVPSAVGALRVVAGAALLLAVARLARAPRPRAGTPLAVAAAGVAGYQLCFFAAVDDTGVAVGTVVALGSAPAFAGLGGWLLSGRLPGRTWAAATTLAAAGVALIAVAGAQADVSAPGVALAAGAGASYALFTLASKALLDAGGTVEGVMAWAFTGGAVLLVPVLAVADLGWAWSGGGAAMVLWLAAVPTALAYLLFARGLRHLPAGDVATLTLAEPVTATVLGATVLAERPGEGAIAGVVLVLAGLAVLAAGPEPEAAPAASGVAA